MIDTLRIGAYLQHKLDGLTTAKPYRVVAEDGATYPYMIYRRVSLSSNGCKDGYYEDSVSVEITIVSTTYKEGVDIASRVREVLEVQHTTFNEMEINDTILSNATESFTSNGYVQVLQFSMTINK